MKSGKATVAKHVTSELTKKVLQERSISHIYCGDAAKDGIIELICRHIDAGASTLVALSPSEQYSSGRKDCITLLIAQ
jgi:hypothetical protein